MHLALVLLVRCHLSQNVDKIVMYTTLLCDIKTFRLLKHFKLLTMKPRYVRGVLCTVNFSHVGCNIGGLSLNLLAYMRMI